MLQTCPECGMKVPQTRSRCPGCGYAFDRSKEVLNVRYTARTDPRALEFGAASGNLDAMYWLAYCKFYGENGFTDDVAGAHELLKKAASQGHQLSVEDLNNWFSCTVNTNHQAANYPLKSILTSFDSLIIFDLETSGLNPQTDRVIEFAAIKVKPLDRELKVCGELSDLIRLPVGERLTPQITELTGITNETLASAGKSEEAVCASFAELVGIDRVLMVAYNAQFDMSFLKSLIQRNGVGKKAENFHALDALTVYKDRREYPHKLKDAIAAYNLDGCVKNSHKAIDDTYSLLEVLIAMDTEKQDLGKYIDLFGYNPKYGVSGAPLPGIRYVAQPYNSLMKLYER
jgi:DNA polymerase-3 subunit epsilon